MARRWAVDLIRLPRCDDRTAYWVGVSVAWEGVVFHLLGEFYESDDPPDLSFAGLDQNCLLLPEEEASQLLRDVMTRYRSQIGEYGDDGLRAVFPEGKCWLDAYLEQDHPNILRFIERTVRTFSQGEQVNGTA